MKTPSPDLLDEEILALGSVDYLDVWSIVKTVSRLAPSGDEPDIRALCLDALERLLATSRLEVGDLYPPGEFSPWPFDVDEALERIRTEWEKLGRPLQPGDIAWFQTPGPPD